jgi:imidazolonepropionase-like amidohydrolase
MPGSSVIIEDGSISDIGREAQSGGASVEIDASGLTLLPGFIDAHVHIGFFPPREVLAGGVTVVRDLAWPPHEIWPLADRSRDGDFDGPLILAAGPMLTVEGGYPTRAAWAPPGTGRVVGAQDAGEAVEEVAAAGACIIKVGLDRSVGPTMGAATLATVCEAAHERGLKVTAHIYGLDELDKALEAGVDELAHMLMSSESIPEGTIARMVSHQTTIVPTLSCRFGDDQAIAIDNLARFLAAGGQTVYGTDLGNRGPRPGIDPREVTALVEAGMTGHAIIASATVDASGYLGLEDRGVLEEGRRADLIGVAGDPLSDPLCLADVRLVVRGGRVVREP